MPEFPEFPKPYEVFEHTADVGLHAFGRTLPEVFVHAAQDMESLLVPAEQVHVVTSRQITVDGHDMISLLIAWLGELVFLFDTEYLLFRDFVIETMSETQLTGRASGEPYDKQRHHLSSAIKAVTWHEAAITRLDQGYQARIIFDLVGGEGMRKLTTGEIRQIMLRGAAWAIMASSLLTGNWHVYP